MQPLKSAPEVTIGAGVYLIPSEKVATLNLLIQTTCYLAFYKATFKDADKMCKSKGMQVMQLESKEESNSIAKFLNDAGFSSTPFYAAQTGTDPKILNGCNSLLNSMLRSEPCNKKMNFMCEKSREPFVLQPFNEGYFF